MNDNISQFRESLRQDLDKLESGHKDRELIIIRIVPLVDMEINELRNFGTAGTRPSTPSIVATFLKVLSQDKDPKFRANVANELGKIAGNIMRYKISLFHDIPNLVEQELVSALKDENQSVRKAATKALRKIGTPSALATIPPKSWWEFW